MRDYNSETDYPIVQSAKENTLVATKRALEAAGIRWCAVQTDHSRTAWSLEFDMCRAWGETACTTLDEFIEKCRG